MSIQVKNISKVYGSQMALDNISFQANQGEILGLLGPNGAGKTTIMKILSCYMPPSSGEAIVDDLKVSENEQEIKRIMGYLPEHNPLYPNMYIKEYLSFVADVHSLKNKEKVIAELIEKTGLTRERNKKIGSLSKGYKQRVGIAQAIIHKPKILILDEPISGLDPNQIIEIRELILGLKKNTTIIFSSHILNEVESICDKIVILDKGKLIVDNKLKEISESLISHQHVVIEFLNTVTDKTLRQISEGLIIEKYNDKKYSIKSSSNSDIRELLFDYAKDSNNKILEMRTISDSLEKVFKSLTKDLSHD